MQADADRHAAVAPAATASPSPASESSTSPAIIREVKPSVVINETVPLTLTIDGAEEQARLLVKVSNLEVQLADIASKFNKSDHALSLTQQALHSSQDALKQEQKKTQALEIQLMASPIKTTSDVGFD